MDEPRQKRNNFTIGEDLYGVSVAELQERISLLNTEIARIEVELTKKQKDFDAAQLLFSPKA